MGMATITQVLSWLSGLDWIKIVSGLVPTTIGVVAVWWKGGFRVLYRRYRFKSATRKYRKDLKNDVSSLIVIGKREGFDLSKVYVDIDITKSDLMGKVATEREAPPKRLVLVGGPGAGKSTYVKKRVLDELSHGGARVPFFIRLREYTRGASIEDLLIRKLEMVSIKDPQDVLRSELREPSSVCILDGLDEVRPDAQKDAYEAINFFYHCYFDSPNSGTLIVTCRKEAYRSIPLEIPSVWEVVPLNDPQILAFAQSWPLGYPTGKSPDAFYNDLAASPRILEVSRSPLLLVGSLLLYTESNLGIPGERVKYLEKIKSTLVEDWAIAQGHPPDPRRIVYTPLLARLALKMQMEMTAELPRAKCIEFIGELLPDYGFESAEAEAVLEVLLTKTGILVRDVPVTLILSSSQCRNISHH